MRKLRLFGLLLVFVIYSLAAPAAPLVESHGTFRDGAGNVHRWKINAAHTLLWEDRPFVPVGGLFQVRSWNRNSTEEDFQSDVAAFALLKSHGVTDVCLQPVRVGLTQVGPQAIGRILAYLDDNGFTYGISLNDGPRDPLVGYVVRPGAFRQVPGEDGGSLRFELENVTSALYFLATNRGEILDSGQATMVAEGARVNVKSLPGQERVVFLLPQKAYFGQAGAMPLPNLWDGFDAYRDSLITLFSHVKLGKGFRFFVDALPPNLSLSGEMERFIPTGVGWETEWGAWLGQKYKKLDSLQNAWSISGRDIASFRDAAGLLPVWSGGKGVSVLYDPKTQKQHKLDTTRSEFWRDLTAFKEASVRNYMNDLAVSLKKAVADVPVVFRSRGDSPLFTSLPATRGFDGIGIVAYGRGTELVTGSAGYVYAQAAEAPKTTWLLVSATADTQTGKTAQGYGSRAILQSDLDWLREIGARGFYVDSVRTADASRKPWDLSAEPVQLDWLGGYGKMLAATSVSASQTVPSTVFYPRNVALGSIRPLQSGGWWLPTVRQGTIFDFGQAGRAYSLAESDGGVTYYLWNPDGPRQIKIRVPKASRMGDGTGVRWSTSAHGELKNDILTLTIGPDPVRVENLTSVPVPLDAFKLAMAEAMSLVAALEKQNAVDAPRIKSEVGNIAFHYNEDNPMTGYGQVQYALLQLRAMLRPYAWMEAEPPTQPGQAGARDHTFDEISERAGASGGQVLVVGQRPPSLSVATAAYRVEVKDAGSYQLWVAASPNAPLTFRLDNQPLFDEATAHQPVGKLYASGTLQWMRCGTAYVPKGIHTLELRASGPCAVDVLLLTKGDFVPDGPNPPPVQP